MATHHTKKSLQQHNLAPHKRFGQNFLVNPHTARAIVDCGNISKDETIIEVGVGLGALTGPLSQKAGRVIGVEIDSGLIRYHQEETVLDSNVTLIHGDILKYDFGQLYSDSNGPLKIMANLPYSISNPFIFKLIEHRQYIDWVIVMLQKEVALRLMAQPSTKEYGIPTILLNTYADIQKLMVISPHEFHPQPKIDSMVIRIDFAGKNTEPCTAPLFDHKLYQQMVRVAFSKRRKTLLNNISSAGFLLKHLDKQQAKATAAQIITSAGLQTQERAENLSLQQFCSLTTNASTILENLD